MVLGTALLAYGLGRRHGVDTDHIAAIDNVTRKLMQERKHPVRLGFNTATGISLLGILGTQAGQGTSIWLIIVFAH